MADFDDGDIDTSDDYELEDDDNAAEEGSVLADSKSIFNSTARDPVNQVVSRDEERQNQASAVQAQGGGAMTVAPKRHLAAVFGENGAMQVAYVVDGVQKEKFRQPTKQEWEQVKLQGYLVKGGLSAAPEVPGAFSIPWKPILIGTGLLAAAAGGYWWYTTREPDMTIKKKRRKAKKAKPEADDGDDGSED